MTAFAEAPPPSRAPVREEASEEARRRSMLKFERTIVSAIVVMLSLAPGASFGADPGVTASEIKIGHTNPYSGPASAYGSLGKTSAAYFKKVNDEGGINGRKINFITYDDAFSPPKTVEMTRRLVEQDKVLLIFGATGTASNTATQKYLNQQKIPQLLISTGATKFGDPKNFSWTMPFNPSYQAEARIYAQYILKNIPDAKIGILYQNDDYGKDLLKGLKDGLGDAAKKLIVMEQTYEVTDPLVDSQVVNLKNSGANVFMNITLAKAAVQSIKKSNDIGWKPVHIINLNAASVGTVLKVAGLDASKGLISTTYLKDPTDPQWKSDPATREWYAFMKQYYPEGNADDTNNVYALVAAQTLAHVLKQCGNDLSRENVMRQAANIKDLSPPLLLPGIKINTSPTDYFPIDQMQVVKFDGERWVPFGEVYDVSKK
jgi:branched-chain amino acid transport system substrate-binding protein